MGNAARGVSTDRERARLASEIAAWSVVSLVGAALPALVVSAFVAFIALQVAVGAARPNALLLFAAFAAVVLWRIVIAGWQAGRAGVTAEDLHAQRRSFQDGGLSVWDRTHALDRDVSGGVALEPAEDLVPGLPRLVQEVAATVGVAVPEHLLVSRAWPGVVLGDDDLVIGAPLLAVASVEEVRAEVARVLVAGRSAHARAQRLAITVHTMGHVITRADSVWLVRALALGRMAADRAMAAARTLAENEASAGRAAAARLLGPSGAVLVRDREVAVAALWGQHVGATQREWTTGSSAVAPLETWPMAYSARAGATVARPEPAWSTPAERLGLVVDDAPAQVPPVAPLPALQSLAGAATDQVMRALDDARAAAYFAPEAVEAYGEPHEDAAAIPTLAEIESEAAAQPFPTLAWIAGQLRALDLAMYRRDGASLALAQALDHPASVPSVRANAAGARWLCGDPNGIEAIRAALREQPRSIATLSPIEGALRAAGWLDVASEIATLRAQADAAITGPVNVTAMFGRGDRLELVALDDLTRRAVGEYAERIGGLSRVWVTQAQGTGEPASSLRPYVVVLKRRNQFAGSIDPDPDLLAAVLPLVRLVYWDEMDTRRRTQLNRGTEPVWDRKAAPAMAAR